MKNNAVNTLVTWFRASEVLPATDGKYLCYLADSGSITELTYCSEVRLFNATKEDTDTAIDVLRWAEVPALPSEGN